MDSCVLRVTESAACRMREFVQKNEALGVRIAVKKGGCAGMEYTVDLVYHPAEKDDHIFVHDVHVYVDFASTLFLIGTELDYEQTDFRSGFVFRNPNQISACGCGESVALKSFQS